MTPNNEPGHHSDVIIPAVERDCDAALEAS